MLESFSSKAVLAKVKAMEGRMLTPGDYEQLMHRSSVSACAAYLKNLPTYAGVLRDVQETQIHRGALEGMLEKTIFEQFLRLSRYVGHNNEFFRQYWISWMEIRCIITCVRLLGASPQAAGRAAKANEFLSSVPGYLIDRLSFNVLALANVHSFDGLLEALGRSLYVKTLERARRSPQEPVSVAAVEHELYLDYYAGIHRLIDRHFHGKTAGDLHALFVSQAQIHNIAVLYRLKRFFGAGPEEVRRLMLPYNGRLPRRFMRRLVEAPDDRAMLEALSHSRYAPYFSPENFSSIEFGLNSIRYRTSRRYLTFSQNPATAFVAFMTLRELEVENLINIIEGVRYGLDASQIRSLLIHST